MNRTYSRKLVRDLLARFAELGPLTSRSMFGGYGICHNNTMFALVADATVYLRADEQLAQEFVALNMQQYIFSKRGLPLRLNYYQVTEAQWSDDNLLTLLIMRALSAALMDKDRAISQKGQRLKDLPNMNASIERLLWQVGVNSVDEFYQIGAITAYLKLKHRMAHLGVNILFTLAGAIDGCHTAVLSDQRRKQLMLELANIEAKNG